MVLGGYSILIAGPRKKKYIKTKKPEKKKKYKTRKEVMCI